MGKMLAASRVSVSGRDKNTLSDYESFIAMAENSEFCGYEVDRRVMDVGCYGEVPVIFVKLLDSGFGLVFLESDESFVSACMIRS